MDHAITVRDILYYTLWAGGIAAVVGVILYVVLVLLNPFSSGH